MPTESRMSPSSSPAARRTAGSIEPWVMLGGCSIRLSTPPRLSASEKSLVRVQSFFPSSTEPLSSNATMPPNPRGICRFATSCPACEARPGK